MRSDLYVPEITMTTFQPTTTYNSPNEQAVSAPTMAAHLTAQRYSNVYKRQIRQSSRKQAVTPA